MKKLFLLVGIFLAGCAAASAQSNCPAAKNNVAKILDNIKQSTESMKSYSADISYLFSQPLFDSKTLRIGKIHYKKNDKQSLLKIEFDTLRQDDGKVQKQRQIYLFDGVWLHRLDYETKQAEKRQLADSNEPVDVFELVKRNFPLVGFSDPAELSENFKISLKNETDKQLTLDLNVKADSVYSEDYKSILVTIGKEYFLPIKIIAVSSEQDEYEITFTNPKINEQKSADIFKLKIPADFEQNTVPLENGREPNG
ncbi:MAG: hypothetical protein PHF37_03655 [Phycisphaerae bacterium]|nr:hypothetical protein [Phycisphaerae bacterium]